MNSRAHPKNTPIQNPTTSPRRWGLSLALLALVLGGIPALALAGSPPTIDHVTYDPAIAAVIAQVSTQTLEYDLNGLTGERPITVGNTSYTFESRKTDDVEAISKATQYTYEQFASYGLNVSYYYYTWTGDLGTNAYYVRNRAKSGSHTSRNVVAEKPGLVHPDQIYLLAAHVDSIAGGTRAPGADDNASGSAAVLTAARLLAPHDFAYTIRFVLFTAEEQGLHGSAAYAANIATRKEDLRGVINLDMIAYNSDAEPLVDLYASLDVPISQGLSRDFASVIDVYDLNLIPERLHGELKTDYLCFLEWGYPAITATEDQDDPNPYYHKSTERVINLDLDYYADITRAVIATIAHLAVPIR